VILVDVNVLVYAHREDAPDHCAHRRWLEDALTGDEPFGAEESVLSGFLRVVTHPRVFRQPSTLEQALAFVGEVREQPNVVVVGPGQRHWDIFVGLCAEAWAPGET
jgi:hypothetical protein